MEKVTIRRAVESDVAEIIACHYHAVVAKNHGAYPPEIVRLWASGLAESDEATMRARVVDPLLAFFVAKGDGRVWGYGSSRLKEGFLPELYVRPNPFGKVGEALLAAMIEAGRTQGFGSFWVQASLCAVGFYARHGFVEAERGEHKLPSGERIAFVSMRLEDASSARQK